MRRLTVETLPNESSFTRTMQLPAALEIMGFIEISPKHSPRTIIITAITLIIFLPRFIVTLSF